MTDHHLLLQRFAPRDRVRARMHIVYAGREAVEGALGTVHHQEESHVVWVAWDGAIDEDGEQTLSPTSPDVLERVIAGPTRMRLGLLADAGWLCDVIERHCPVALEADVELRDALRSVRASIALHEGDTVRAPANDSRPPWRSKWPADWPACVTASCDEPASFGFSWPGQQRLSACFGCILKVLSVGEALGLDAKALELVYLPAVKP